MADALAEHRGQPLTFARPRNGQTASMATLPASKA